MGRRAALLDNVVNAFRCGAVVQGDSGISEAEKKNVCATGSACEFLVHQQQLFLRTGWVVSTSLPG